MLSRVLCLPAALALLAVPAASAAQPGPALTTPAAKLARALRCHGALAGARHDPVLLVHGTFANAAINWNWSWARTLPAQGRTACTVDLPDKAAGDAQASTEYVVAAIRTMARKSGRQVAVVAHSQGGLEARWALRWWPDVRKDVSDLVMLATPNHGALYPDNTCSAPSACSASLYQMRSDSKFLSALNAGGEAPGGVDYTAVVTTNDKIFVLPAQGRLNGPSSQVSNIAVQDICPGHAANHQELAFDAPAFAIAMDALTHPGPARASRVSRASCKQGAMPGVTHAQGEAKLNAYLGELARLLGPSGPKAPGEPALAAYAAAR